MRDADIQTLCLNWFKTGQFQGLKYGMTEFEVIQLLGNPESVHQDESIEYRYESFSILFYFPNSLQTDRGADSAVPFLSEVSMWRDNHLSRALGGKSGQLAPTLKEVAAYLDHHSVEHDFWERSRSQPWNANQIQTITTTNQIHFNFSNSSQPSHPRLYEIVCDSAQGESLKFYTAVIYTIPNQPLSELDQTPRPNYLQNLDVKNFRSGNYISFVVKGDGEAERTKVDDIARRFRAEQGDVHVQWRIF